MWLSTGNNNKSFLRWKIRGIGIPQEEIEHIFQSFYRGSNTRDYAGQGIGLSLTLKIISAYHAKLDISSEIEKGTKVRVIFNSPFFYPFLSLPTENYKFNL